LEDRGEGEGSGEGGGGLGAAGRRWSTGERSADRSVALARLRVAAATECRTNEQGERSLCFRCKGHFGHFRFKGEVKIFQKK
jgi:hypothetical protein